MDKAIETFIRNLANINVNELSDYRAKQELDQYVSAAKTIVKMYDDKEMIFNA